MVAPISCMTLPRVTGLMRDPQASALLERLYTHHPSSFAHSVDIALLGVDIALEEGMTWREADILGYAGLLHDVGKIKIPLRILDKPGPLTEEEQEVMRYHVRGSFELLERFPHPHVRELIVTHHEGPGGYPRSGNGAYEGKDRRTRKILVEFLDGILSVSDKLVSLSEPRAYKPALHYDALVSACARMFGNDPLVARALKRFA